MAKTISKKVARAALEKRAKKVTTKDVESILKKEKQIESRYKKVPEELKKLVMELRLLFELVKDYWKGKYRKVPYFSIAMSVTAIIYFLSPIDLIPDAIPGVGYLDDALVLALALKSIEEDLREYCAFKGYDPTLYF